MPYATVDELRQYLKQIDKSAENDDTLDVILSRATSVIDTVLGFSFAPFPDVATAQTIYADGSPFLTLPPVQADSVASVTTYDTTITGYGVQQVRNRVYLYQPNGWPFASPLYVLAKWGYGPAPEAITKVCLELAVNDWRAKDRGLFTDVIGVESSGGAVVGYAGAMTNQQKMIVQAVKASWQSVGF